ncbi:hypothetical protein O3P69_016451 [Scylla paramamosain]|uniref:Alpha-amylase n=1 Tax=Scylla paramamosain TaxID=85552 RepID=A0AAW0TDA9_SCYPA
MSQIRTRYNVCRVVVDAVINNMAEQHTTGYGSAGNFYDTDSYTFPPYDDPYFFSSSCPSPDGMVSSYSDPSEVRDCRLEGRLDLATGKHPLQLIIAYYLNELLSYGVVGFRIDAASNIWPKHLQEIRNQLTNLSESAGFPANTLPFIYQDVVPPGTAILPQDYYDTGSKSLALDTMSSYANVLGPTGARGKETACCLMLWRKREEQGEDGEGKQPTPHIRTHA